jgi:uncharacterized protein DUF4326
VNGRIYDPQPGEPSYVRPDALPPPPTRVVNIRRDRYDVYAGRNSQGIAPVRVGEEGWLGNPHVVAGGKRKWCPACNGGPAHEGRAALDLYREYLERRTAVDVRFREAVLALRGAVLGCFCVRADGSGECHARVLAAWVDAQPR